MQKLTIEALARKLLGKKVKALRKEGLVPVSVYGRDVKSQPLAVKLAEFGEVYRKAGETGLVEIKYEGKSLPTLIANVQIHPVTRVPLHVEFHAVKLTEKIKAKVPVELEGESPAVASNLGILLQTVKEVEVEALPADLPEKITAEVAKLAEVGQLVTVAELVAPTGVAILTDKEEIVVKVASAVSEETRKELAAEEVAKAAVAPAAGGESAPAGEVPVTSAEEKKSEEKLREEKKE